MGRTSRDGEEVADRPIRAHDFLATICLALGIDPASEYDIQTGVRVSPGDRIPPERRVRLANASAEPVRDILSR